MTNQEIINNIEDFKNRLDLAVNYLNCINYEQVKGDKFMVKFSLNDEHGLNNINTLISNVSTELQQLADTVVDGVTND